MQNIIPRDDLEDIMELNNKMRSEITKILEDHQKNIRLSCLIGTLVNMILDDCKDMDSALHLKSIIDDLYKNAALDMFVK